MVARARLAGVDAVHVEDVTRRRDIRHAAPRTMSVTSPDPLNLVRDPHQLADVNAAAARARDLAPWRLRR
jgi:hypothetical protein